MDIATDPLTNIPDNIIAKIPESVAVKQRVIPLGMKGDRLVLGMEDPNDYGTLDTVRFAIGVMNVDAKKLSKEDIDRGLGRYYGQSFEKSMEQSISLAEAYL